MNDAPHDIDDLFAVAREVKAPRGAAARGWLRFESAVAVPASATATPVVKAASVWASVAKGVAVAAVAVGLAVPLARHGLDGAREPIVDARAPVDHHAGSTPAPVAREADPAMLPAIAPAQVRGNVERPEIRAGAAAPQASTRPAAARSNADALRVEAELLGRAWVAIRDREASTIQTLLAEHTRRFPDGALVPERRACERVAACIAGDRHAIDDARRYLDQHGDSHLAARVRSGCGLPIGEAGSAAAADIE